MLGLLLFGIYINDLPSVSHKLYYVMYAVDATLCFTLQDFPYKHLDTFREVNLEPTKIIY